jgi:hypothetical protein
MASNRGRESVQISQTERASRGTRKSIHYPARNSFLEIARPERDHQGAGFDLERTRNQSNANIRMNNA